MVNTINFFMKYGEALERLRKNLHAFIYLRPPKRQKEEFHLV